jgi:tetratricopeptide (TPR) repeat protein
VLSQTRSRERALGALPADEAIARSLERVCESTGDSQRVSELLASRAERTADGAERSALLVRAARHLIDLGEVPKTGNLPRPIALGDPRDPRDRRVAESALGLVDRARAANPESLGAGLYYGSLAMALERPRDATTAFYAIIERSAGKRPRSLATVYLELGKAHLHPSLDEFAEALEALKAGFAIDLRNGELAMLLGLLALDLGDEKTAERAFLAVVTLARKEESSPDLSTTAERASFAPPAPSSSALGEAGAADVRVEIGSDPFLPASGRADMSRRQHQRDALMALCHLAAMAYSHRDFIKSRRWISKAIREDPSHPEALALLQRLDANDRGAFRGG